MYDVERRQPTGDTHTHTPACDAALLAGPPYARINITFRACVRRASARSVHRKRGPRLPVSPLSKGSTPTHWKPAGLGPRASELSRGKGRCGGSAWDLQPPFGPERSDLSPILLHPVCFSGVLRLVPSSSAPLQPGLLFGLPKVQTDSGHTDYGGFCHSQDILLEMPLGTYPWKHWDALGAQCLQPGFPRAEHRVQRP